MKGFIFVAYQKIKQPFIWPFKTPTQNVHHFSSNYSPNHTNIKNHKLFNRLKAIATMKPFLFSFYPNAIKSDRNNKKLPKERREHFGAYCFMFFFYYCYQCYCYVSYYDFTIIVGELIYFFKRRHWAASFFCVHNETQKPTMDGWKMVNKLCLWKIMRYSHK